MKLLCNIPAISKHLQYLSDILQHIHNHIKHPHTHLDPLQAQGITCQHKRPNLGNGYHGDLINKAPQL